MTHTISPSLLVPRIGKSSFDCVATQFLSIFYPEALHTPMPVPIINILRKKMGLNLVYACLTEDFSVFGQICFDTGYTMIYKKDIDEYKSVPVRGGTVIIDPDTLKKRNLGCLNNTVAHEGVHWFLHRDYYHFLNQYVANAVACHCPADENRKPQYTWTDEDRMEWQANNIAPRILMPIQTVKTVYDMYGKEYDYSANRRDIALVDYEPADDYKKRGINPRRIWVRDKVAEFFRVSKQSAAIRLEELGLVEKGCFSQYFK